MSLLNKDEALWLPRRSIRAILSILLVGCLVALSFVLVSTEISPKNEKFLAEIIGAIIMLVGIVVRDYFKEGEVKK